MSLSQPTFAEALAANPQINPTWAALSDLTYGADVVVILTPAGSTHIFAAEAGTGDLTGASEPNWDVAAPNPGDTVVDGGYTWVNVGLQSSTPIPTTWAPSTDYSAANTSIVLVWPMVPNGHLYLAYPGYFGSSGASEPSFPVALGHYIADGGGYWQDLGPTLITEPAEKLVVLGAYDYQTGEAIWLGLRASDGAPIVQANKRQFGADPTISDVTHTSNATPVHPDGDVFYSALRGTDAKVQQFDRLLEPTANRWPTTGPNHHTILSVSCDASGFVYYAYLDNDAGGALKVTKLTKALTLVTTFALTTPPDLGSRSHISADGTTLYYLNTNGVGALTLASDTYADLITTGPAASFGGLILVKTTGNLVYVVIGGLTSNRSISEYTVTGALVTTQAVATIGNEGAIDRAGEPYVWIGDANSPSQFFGQYLISTGALAQSVPYTALDATLDPADVVVLGALAPAALRWPVWLQDGTFVAFVGTFLGDGYVVRYDLKGRETQRFSWTPGIHPDGACGIAASLDRDACDPDGSGRLYVFFGATGGAAAALAFDLLTGKQIGDLMSLTGIADADTNIAAGVVHLTNAGPSTDGSIADLDDDGTIDESGEPPICAPPGPGGSSFDGSPDGDRTVQSGGYPAVYVPPTGEGAVATAADPADPQDLATMTTPLVSADLTVCDETVYRLAKSELPRPGEPPCDARVLRVSDIPYPLANRFGSLAAQTFEIEIADPDGVFRSLADQGVNRFWKRWTIKVYLEDDSARLQNVPRQPIARGRCVSVRTGRQDQTLVLVFSDEYSRHDSPFSLDRELPPYLIGDIFGEGATSADLVTVPIASGDIGEHAATIVGGEGSDEYRAAETPPVTPIGILPVHDLGDVQLGSETWRAYFGTHYASYRIPALFGSNLDPNCPASVRLDPALYDGTQDPEFLVPGYAPWDAYFANRFIRVTRNGRTFDCTLIFGRGPISDAHVEQKVPLSVNLDGIPSDDGNLIDDAAYLLQWLLDHPTLRRTSSGIWGAVATFPDGIAKIRTSDFAAVKTIHDARLSGRYRAAFILDQRRAARDWIADLCVSWGIRLGLNHHGQITAHALDTQTSLANLRTFTDLLHIRDESFKVTSELNAELENSIEFEAGPEPASGRTTVPKQTITAPDSIRDWGDTYAAQPITYVGVYRPDVAGNVTAFRLIETQDGITRGEFDVDLAGGTVRGGELMRLTHLAGIGETGWRNRVLRATTRTLAPDDLGGEGLRTRVEWEDAHSVLVKPGTDDEPRFGFKPIGSWVAQTGWIIGGSEAGTAYRAG